MKLLSILVFLFISLFSFAQDSTYFNKLIFPQHGSNSTANIIDFDSSYYILHVWLDTPYVNNQGIGLMKIDRAGDIVQNQLWWDTVSYFLVSPGNSMIMSKDSFLYIAASYSRGNNGILSYLIKVDPQTLDTLWTRTYTHPDTAAAAQPGANIFNAFTAIRQTYDGGFIITGMYNPGCVQNATRKAYLLKTDSAGNPEWIRKYSTITSLYDIELAPDSGYYFPAVINLYTPRVYKINKLGVTEWYLNVNSNTKSGYPMDLEILGSNYLFVSSKYLYDLVYLKAGITLTKVNTNTHTKVWEKNYIVFNNFTCQSLHQSMGLDIMPSGDLVISGTVEMLNPNNTMELYHKGVIMKVNSNGDSLWARWHGHGLFADDCQINDMVLTDDGGFLAVGWQWHNNGGLFYQNAWLLKMDSMGCDTAGCDIYDALSQPPIRPNINMKLYPNPTSNYFRISAEGVDKLRYLQVIITDMQGRIVRSKKLNNIIDELIDTQDLKPGVYSVSLFASDLLLEVQRLTIVK